MVLNYIWIGFFLVGFVVASAKMLFLGDMDIFPAIMRGTFDDAKLGFTLSLGLTGVMCLWLGIMKIGERGGVTDMLARGLRPLFRKLFPDLPKDSKASSAMVMNIAANMLGLDNAATPLGLKAMDELQKSNPDKKSASNPMIMFLVLNTSGLTLIPVSVMVYRAQMGAADPADIFIPILLATFFSTMAGIVAVAAHQRINLLNRTIVSYLGGLSLLIAGIIWLFSRLGPEEKSTVSAAASNFMLFWVIATFITLALIRKVNVYEAFISGARDGFKIAVKIIPFLVAILVAIGVFRTSGAMDYIISGIAWFFELLGVNTDFVPALPTAFMKPLTGGGARGMMVEAMQTYGTDSFVGQLASTFQGSTDTTFYVIAVYFGSVGIRRTRHAVSCGLIADLAGILAAIFIAYLFFH